MTLELNDIVTRRLLLRTLSAEFLRATVERRSRHELGALLGFGVPGAWFEDLDLVSLRLDDLIADPSYARWSLRAVIVKELGEMIGHVGFHSRPGAAYLGPNFTDAVEIGYTIFMPYRRQGYAFEAIRGLLDWASRVEGVHRFIASVSPANHASLSLLFQAGFQEIGAHDDPDDGRELVMLLQGNMLHRFLGLA